MLFWDEIDLTRPSTEVVVTDEYRTILLNTLLKIIENKDTQTQVSNKIFNCFGTLFSVKNNISWFVVNVC